MVFRTAVMVFFCMMVMSAGCGDRELESRDCYQKSVDSVSAADKEKSNKQEAKVSEFTVSEKNQKELLKLARNAIETYIKTRKMPQFSSSDSQMLTDAAVFVTLTKKGLLRGCIGTTEPRAPLYQAVMQMACSAAFNDYRFPSVNLDELDDIHIEISVLSPMSKVDSYENIEMEKHGVVVSRGRHKGLFLPQVWEHFSSRDAFLSELCSQKAGLPRDAYKDPDVDLHVFTVFAFEEEEEQEN